MLPNIRIIVVTFMCGFVLVFASLRVVATSRAAQATLWNSVSEPIAPPLLFAAADEAATPIADAAPPSPMSFETRFAVETPAVIIVPASLTLHAISLATRAEPAPLASAVETPSQSIASESAPAAAPEPTPQAIVPAKPATSGMSSTTGDVAVPSVHRIAPALPVAALEQAGKTSEPSPAGPVERVVVAALPEPMASPVEPAADDITASIQQERDTPQPVPTAGTSQPMPVAETKPVAAPKAAEAKKIEPKKPEPKKAAAKAKRAVKVANRTRPRAAAPRSPAAQPLASRSAAANPFLGPFGGAPAAETTR